MSIGEIHNGDIGTVIVFTIKDQNGAVVNISNATTKQILMRSPYDKLITKTGAFTTNGIDGKLQYTTIIGDLNATGTWDMQAYIVTPAGAWKSDISSVIVYKNVP